MLGFSRTPSRSAKTSWIEIDPRSGGYYSLTVEVCEDLVDWNAWALPGAGQGNLSRSAKTSWIEIRWLLWLLRCFWCRGLWRPRGLKLLHNVSILTLPLSRSAKTSWIKIVEVKGTEIETFVEVCEDLVDWIFVRRYAKDLLIVSKSEKTSQIGSIL